MTKQFWQFLVVLIALLLVGFFIQEAALNHLKLPTSRLLLKAYSANFMVAVLIFIVIEKLRKTQTNSLGFIFMGGSLLKFLVFFVFFLPAFKADDNLSKPEFFFFFIPYTISLIVEVIFLIQLLNTESKEKS